MMNEKANNSLTLPPRSHDIKDKSSRAYIRDSNIPYYSTNQDLPFPNSFNFSRNESIVVPKNLCYYTHPFVFYALMTLAFIWLIILQGLYFVSNHQAALISSLVLLSITFLLHFFFKRVEWIIVILGFVMIGSGVGGIVVGGVLGRILVWMSVLSSSWACQRMLMDGK